LYSVYNEENCTPLKVEKELVLEAEMPYEIYDVDGNIKLKGIGKIINVSILKKGIYYLSTDFKLENFIKR